ncbi:MAG: RNA pseudouridine synthase, partial [Alphaproteobacteria bacterium]|nr:RNA pseudouridine synthase [Alphaproteobacteria bacterium]
MPPAAIAPPGDAPAPGRYTFAADATAAGHRLDRCVADWLPGLSRSRAKALIEAGCVARVAPDAARATMADASHKVKAAEAYAIDVPESVEAAPRPQAI